MKTLFSGYPKACLTALLMLVCSLSGRASTYDIEMGELAQGSNQLLNQNGVAVWTYATSGDVGHLCHVLRQTACQREPAGAIFLRSFTAIGMGT